MTTGTSPREQDSGPTIGSPWPADLAGRRIIVTGAGGGIGRAVTRRLASLGATVIGIGRRPEPLRETARGCSATAVRCLTLDVRSAEAPAVIAEQASDGLDAVVHCAGGQFVADADDISERGFRAVLDLNLLAVDRITRATIPWLTASCGAVLVISLSAPEAGIARLAHSATGRAAAIGLTRQLARRHPRVRFNSLAPGTVLTDGMRAELSDAELTAALSHSLFGTDTRATDVADWVAFLVSDRAAGISGQHIELDGGAGMIGAGNALAPTDREARA